MTSSVKPAQVIISKKVFVLIFMFSTLYLRVYLVVVVFLRSMFNAMPGGSHDILLLLPPGTVFVVSYSSS